MSKEIKLLDLKVGQFVVVIDTSDFSIVDGEIKRLDISRHTTWGDRVTRIEVSYLDVNTDFRRFKVFKSYDDAAEFLHEYIDNKIAAAKGIEE